MATYTSRPSRGNGRKAWDKFKLQYSGEEPAFVEYCPNYDYEFKGWVCEWHVVSVEARQMSYSRASQHTFYHSSEL